MNGVETLDIAICVPHTSTRIHRTETVLARRLTQLGHRVKVVVFQVQEIANSPRGPASLDGVDFFFLRGKRLAESIYVPMAGKRVPALGRPDVVHVTEDTQTITFWADRFARARGLPLCVSTNRGREPGTASRRMLYRNAERLFGRTIRETAQAFSVHTPAQLEFLKGRGMRRDPKNVRVIPNMVDTSRFTARKERSANPCMKFAGEGLSFLSVGRLVRNKGYEHLLTAFAQVAKARPDARLTIIGRGPLEAALRAQAAQLGVADRVLLHTEFVDNAEMPLVYPHFSVYVQPSVVEPFGIAVLEAMSCGLPVVASRMGGLAFSVVDGKTGRHVEPGNAASLASAMLSMGDERLRMEMGDEGAKRAREVYDWQLVADAYLELYGSAMAQPGPWRLARVPKTTSGEKPLRVAIAVASLGVGRGRNEVALSRFLIDRGHRAAIVTCKVEGQAQMGPGWHEVSGVPVLVLYSLRLGAGIYQPMSSKRTLQRDWVDLFHATEDSQGITQWASSAARAAKRPFAVSTERYEMPSTRLGRVAYLGAEFAFARGVRRKASALAVRSDAVQRWLEGRPGFRARKTDKIPNAVDATYYRPDFKEHPIVGSHGNPAILSVGRLAPNKDYATLVDAMAIVRGAHPHATATVLGRGPLKDELAARVNAKGLHDCVRFEESFILEDQFPGVYPAFDLYTQPSRVEPMALSALEAMASGLPIIASAVGGMTEVVHDGVNGFLVPPGNPQALADAITKAAEPETLARLSEGARRVALQEFDWQVVGAKWMHFYESALGGPPPSASRGAAPSPERTLS